VEDNSLPACINGALSTTSVLIVRDDWVVVGWSGKWGAIVAIGRGDIDGEEVIDLVMRCCCMVGDGN